MFNQYSADLHKLFVRFSHLTTVNSLPSINRDLTSFLSLRFSTNTPILTFTPIHITTTIYNMNGRVVSDIQPLDVVQALFRQQSCIHSCH